jgi:hypothetical protein
MLSLYGGINIGVGSAEQNDSVYSTLYRNNQCITDKNRRIEMLYKFGEKLSENS